MDIYLNGRMVPYDRACISHDDAGCQHAVGLFETMAAFHGRAFRLKAHIDRLVHSARDLGMARDLDGDELGQAVTEVLSHNRLEEARIRLTVTPGRVSLLRPSQSDAANTTVLVVATEPVRYDPTYFEQGISVLIAPPIANPFDPMAGHKTLAYWTRLRLLRQAATAKAGEAIVLNVTNHLAGGTISNLCLVKDEKLLTPFARGEEVQGALTAPVLPGITRAAILKLAAGRNLLVEKRMLSVDDLLGADEVFLTNSSWQVLPVTRIEKSRIADGAVGPVTRKLRADLIDLIDRETQ